MARSNLFSQQDIFEKIQPAAGAEFLFFSMMIT
jgi:hypothetical protein